MTTLEICVIDRQAVFVCGAWGPITIDMLTEIEHDLREELPWELPLDTEIVKVTATRQEAMMDDSIDPPRVAMPGYWDLNLLEQRGAAA